MDSLELALQCLIFESLLVYNEPIGTSKWIIESMLAFKTALICYVHLKPPLGIQIRLHPLIPLYHIISCTFYMIFQIWLSQLLGKSLLVLSQFFHWIVTAIVQSDVAVTTTAIRLISYLLPSLHRVKIGSWACLIVSNVQFVTRTEG